MNKEVHPGTRGDIVRLEGKGNHSCNGTKNHDRCAGLAHRESAIAVDTQGVGTSVCSTNRRWGIAGGGGLLNGRGWRDNKTG